MTPVAIREEDLLHLQRGTHVCWVVGRDEEYADLALKLVGQGTAANEKVILFGPADDAAFASLSGAADVAVDPLAALLGGRFDAEAMFAIFREQDRVARAEGYGGLSIVADMNWLLGAEPSLRDIVGYELLGDRLVRDLGATAVCAYRTSSFDPEIILGAQAVHACSTTEPPFQFVAGDRRWVLRGEIDQTVTPQFAAALDVVTGEDGCTIDLAGVDFMDARGMRALATSCAEAGPRTTLAGTSPWLRRMWAAAALEQIAPLENHGSIA